MYNKSKSNNWMRIHVVGVNDASIAGHNPKCIGAYR
jgi:hypothetical protein